MEEKNVPFLCGGVFLTLILQVKASWRTKKQIMMMGSKRHLVEESMEYGDNNANTDVLAALIRLFVADFEKPTAGRTFDGETTKFKSCAISYTTNLPFDDEAAIEQFDRNVKNQYGTMRQAMQDVISIRVNLKGNRKEKGGLLNGQWLLQALLTLIADDNSIKDDEVFYALESGKPVSKKRLLEMSTYDLDALVLGIWHYILMNRNLDNEGGAETYLAWHEEPGKESKRSVWKFICPIGNTYPKPIRAKLFDGTYTTKFESANDEAEMEREEESTMTNCNEESLEDEEEQIDAESIEAEVVDDDEFQSKQNKKKSNNSGGQTMIFNNDGDGDMFCFVGTINNYGK